MSNKSTPFLDVIKKFLGYVMILMILILLVLFGFGIIDFMKFLETIITIVLSLLGLFLFTYIIYHSFFERLICERNRKKSAEVLVNDMGKTRQVSGDTRAGKDTATTGAAFLISEIELERDLLEMEKLREILYIYDFKRLHEYIDKKGKSFLVSGRERLLRRYTRAMITNESFIKASILKNKKINPNRHIQDFIFHSETKVQRFRLEDGLTPGGRPFAQLLFEYIILYTYRVYVNNFIMSNQPILEALEIDDQGNMKKNFSKKFSQNYLKIKLDGPLPYPLRGVIIETEMAIFLSNVDKMTESEAKSINGIREFFTIVGHILGERVYLFDIVQDPHRQIKTVRELYQSYLHVFKKEEVCTAPIRRWINEKRIDLLKNQIKVQKINKKLTRKKSKSHRMIDRKIEYQYERIYNLHQKNEQLNSNGFLKIYIGVYNSLHDVTKRVKFPKFTVKMESENENIISTAYGFVLYIRKSDSFGRFNTHFMEWVREQRHIKHSLHFYDVANWETFEVKTSDAIESGYPAMKELTTTVEAEQTDKVKLKQQIELLLEVQKKSPVKFKNALEQAGVYKEALEITRERKKKKRELSLPLLDNLTQDELQTYAADLGIKFVTYQDYCERDLNKFFEGNINIQFEKLLLPELINYMNDIEDKHYINYRHSAHQIVFAKIRNWDIVSQIN